MGEPTDRDDQTGKAPKVLIVRPARRNYQIPYTCPKTGVRKRLTVGSRNEVDAARLKQQVEAKLLLDLEVTPKTQKPIGPEMPWAEFRELYRASRLKFLRDSSAMHAESRLDIAERIIKPKTLGDFVRIEKLRKYLETLRLGVDRSPPKPRSPHAAKSNMATVAAALNWAWENELLSTKPRFPKVETPKTKRMKGRPLTESEVERMIAAVEPVVGKDATKGWNYLLHGILESGLRLQEVMGLSWDDPHAIRPHFEHERLPTLVFPAAMQKNDTDQSVPMLPSFEALLLQTPQDERKGWVFHPMSLQPKLGRGASPYRPTAEWVGRVISRIGRKAGIVVEPANERTGRNAKYASAHDLRRTFAQRLRNKGVAPLLISVVMRHASWETTQKHYAPGDVQKDAENLRKALLQGDQK